MSAIFARRHWIPPAALVYAQLAHGISWLLLLWLAWSGNLPSGVAGFAWVHTVALGWVTMAALAVLVHALPNFVDVEWRGESLARWSLAAYGAGVALLVYGFLAQPRTLGVAGAVVAISLLLYLGCAFATLAGTRLDPSTDSGRVQRAVARAFTGTFLFLLVTALIGFGLAWMLSGHAVAAWIAALPAAHGNLGILGWLSLLIFGVSMRTLRPITGGGTRFRWVHIVVGSLAAIGVPVLAIGVALNASTIAWIGGALFALAALVYAFDVFDILRRATNPHRPPQAFVAASVCWFLIALTLGGFVLTGRPWSAAYVFVLLMGWVGQMVNAHLYHIGIRVLATVYRGDNDETPPQELLEARLSWYSFFAFQLAIAGVTVALIESNETLVARSAIFGITAWIAMAANILAARVRAKRFTPSQTIRL
jgi:hypothetical protein